MIDRRPISHVEQGWHIIRHFLPWRLAVLWIPGILFFGACIVASTILLNTYYGRMYTAIESKNDVLFVWMIGTIISIYAFSVGSTVIQWYIKEYFILRWRQWMLTRVVGQWVRGRAYRLSATDLAGIDNPDQRIEQDITEFTHMTVDLAVDIAGAAMTLVCFLGLLWSLSGVIHLGTWPIHGHLVWCALLYSVIGSWVASLIGYQLIPLKSTQEKTEADLRYQLIVLRHRHSTSPMPIFYHRIRAIALNMRFIIRKQFYLHAWVKFYAHLSYIFPVAMAAPRYFWGDITFGQMMQIGPAFGAVGYAMSILMEKYDAITKWRAVTDRLWGIMDVMKRGRRDAA